MSGRSEEHIETAGSRDDRHRELRELLVSAADAARQTRQSGLSATLNRTASRVRDRVSMFLAAAR